MKKLNEISLITKIIQVIFFLSIIIFFIMILSRGLFTTFISFISVIATGIIALFINIIKKNWTILIINIIICFLIFLIYFLIPA